MVPSAFRLLLAVILLPGLWAAAEQAPEARFAGTYTWSSQANKQHQLVCVLRPGADGAVQAAFTATWKGEDKAYSAVLSVDKEKGTLSGPASVKKSNDYTVRGRIADGVFSAEFFTPGKDGTEKPAGNFSMKLAAN